MRKDYSIECDVYSLGICVWEVITGRQPYVVDNEVLYWYDLVRIASEAATNVPPRRPTPLPDQQPFASLITNLWSPQPHDRPTAIEAYDRLTSMMSVGKTGD